MKKLAALLVALILLWTGAVASADPVDLKTLNDTELLELLTSVQKEIVDRRIQKSAELSTGSYRIGKDIPAGVYDISVVYKGSLWMDIYVYADGGDGDRKYNFTVFSDESLGNGTGNFHVALEEGDLLRCTAPITLTVSAGILFR